MLTTIRQRHGHALSTTTSQSLHNNGRGGKDRRPRRRRFRSQGSYSFPALPSRLVIVAGLCFIGACSFWSYYHTNLALLVLYRVFRPGYYRPPPEIAYATREDRPRLYGKKTTAFYRFDAKLLGTKFEKIMKLYDEVIGYPTERYWKNVDLAARYIGEDTLAVKHGKECYESPDEMFYVSLEEEKKFVRTVGRVITTDGNWKRKPGAKWYMTPGQNREDFREALDQIFQEDDGYHFPETFNSGTFWYPPKHALEWHTNAFVPQHNYFNPFARTNQWLLYYTRILPGTRNDTATPKSDRSAMHVLESEGATPHDLKNAGGYRITNYQGEKPDVWRLPDLDGHVTFFRLSGLPLYRWHCIVSEDVNRFSLGFQFNEEDVEKLLEIAGIPF